MIWEWVNYQEILIMKWANCLIRLLFTYKHWTFIEHIKYGKQKVKHAWLLSRFDCDISQCGNLHCTMWVFCVLRRIKYDSHELISQIYFFPVHSFRRKRERKEFHSIRVCRLLMSAIVVYYASLIIYLTWYH